MLTEKILNPEEFLALSRSSHPDWQSSGNANLCSWVFRGQKKCGGDGKNWKLLPSAWRSNVMKPYLDKLRGRISPDNFDPETNQHELQVYQTAQYLLLREFGNLCVSIGLEGNSYKSQHIDQFSEHGLLPEHSLGVVDASERNIQNAQHYGIPTLLLDWSYSATISAFHALEDHPPETGGEVDIILWCFNTEGVKGGYCGGINFVFSSTNPNSFLVAQRGLFTSISYDCAHRYFLDYGEWPSLEGWLGSDAWKSEAECTNSFPSIGKRSPELQKVVLKAKDVPAVRAALRREGVSSAHLKPTHENVAKVVMGDLKL